MQKLQHQTLSFDDFTLDLARGCLLRSSEEVKLRPKSFEVLRQLVENNDRLMSKAELMRGVWPDSFVTDDSLVQCLIEIRRALEDDVHRYIKTVPRRGYVFRAEVISHDLADRELVYAKDGQGGRITFEEKEKEEQTFGGAEVVAAPQGKGTELLQRRLKRRKLALSALVVSALTLGTLGAYFLTDRDKAIDSVAVMPFVNAGGEPELEYLADGLTESVICNVSQLSNLKVMSRNAVFRYKGKEIDPQAVGRELGVRAVLISRLERHGDDLAISLELVDARDNRQLWGERYNRKLSDLITVQTDISRAVSERLRLRLTGAEQTLLAKRYTDNTEAYQLYLKGRYFWNKRTEQDLDRGIHYFERAINLDPSYALAYSGLADCYAVVSYFSKQPFEETFPKAEAAAAKALILDEGLSEAHATLGLYYSSYDWNWPRAEREHKRALALNPNYATAHQWYGWYLMNVGRPDEGIREMERALELDPVSVAINVDVGSVLVIAHRPDDAIRRLETSLEMDQSQPEPHYLLALAYEQKGELARSIPELEKAAELAKGRPYVLALLGRGYALVGEKAKALRIISQLKAMPKETNVSTYDLAVVFLGLGEKDKALTALETACQARANELTGLKAHPIFDGLRNEPRFQKILACVGLA